MAAVKTKSKTVKPKDVGKYIDPRTDFGFKRLFGDKELMMAFLNAVLDVKDKIVELHYKNTVRTGVSKDDRSAIFDLYCTTGNGEQIIVEMQNIPHEYFKDRIVHYASRLIQEQPKKGKGWDYMLPPVYSINIVDYKLDKESKTDDYLSIIKLMNCKTNEVFYDKLTLVFLELPRFKIKEEDLKTDVEKWMYALKHLPELNKMPAKLRARIFRKLFELAQIAKMTNEQQTDYYKSLHDMSIVKIQFGKMEKTIADQAAKIAEYERRFGALGDTTAHKPARPTKVRARNSAKTQAAADVW